VRRGLRGVAVGGALLAAAAATGPLLVLVRGDGHESPSVPRSVASVSRRSAGATQGVPYCETARAALAYEGNDAAERDALLHRVVDAAPGEVVATVRRVRAATPGTPRYTRAKHLWDYYNNTHCCQCRSARRPPEISELTTEERTLIEAGKSISR
jgi:hypothetical protein